MEKKVYLYVLDTMADWECAYLCAELNTGRYFKKGQAAFKIVTVGLSRETIVTMGGLKITPDVGLDQFTMADTAALLLPGGETWLEPQHEPVLGKVAECLSAGIVVGAICGATLGLAKAGLLEKCWHTSNDPGFLKMTCPNYTGENFYRQKPAVTDGRLVTASGTASLEFAVEVFKALDVFSPRTLDAWYQLYRTHEASYFYELMESIQSE